MKMIIEKILNKRTKINEEGKKTVYDETYTPGVIFALGATFLI